jgi:UDP-GlcNAc:undecaprenyl-phosphate GlcNAc-1-phosphate transferase
VREYLLVMGIAAAVTYLLTPVVRLVAIRWGAMAKVRDRDVHAIPTPRLGGVAMYAGICAALMIAHLMPTLRRSFEANSYSTAILIACGLICALGALDDRIELEALAKLAGQVVAAGVMVLLGVQLALIYVGFGGVGTYILSRDQAVPLTILFCVLTVNAMNWIDGLDGLAAGVAAISALAFFVYSYHLGYVGYGDVAFTSTLMSAVLAGACLGFLPHNFQPARIFMGDSGSMLVGLMLASSATTATSADPQAFQNLLGSLPLVIGLLIPLGVLAIPLGDLVLTMARRVRAGRAPWVADKLHLHHRLLEIGHSQRRAVLIIYLWTALLAFGGVAMSVTNGLWLVLSVVGGTAVVALVLVNLPRLRPTRRVG